MKIRSLRWRLVTGILAGITLVLAGGGWLAYSMFEKRLYTEFDRGLLERAESLAPEIEMDEDRLVTDWKNSGFLHPPGHDHENEFYQIWRESGFVLERSHGESELILPRFAGSLDSPEFRNLELGGGRFCRAVGVRILPGVDDEAAFPVQEPPVDFVIARTDTVLPMLAGVRNLMIGLWAACSICAALLVWFIVRHNMRQIDALSRQIAALKGAAAEQRVTLSDLPSEIAPVADELNRLLQRNEAAIVRERNLTSNVAHELRTPLAGILSTLEVALSRERTGEEYRQAGEDSFEIAKQMHWLVNNLLSMTRIEVGDVKLHSHPIELQRALHEWWQPFEARAADRQIHVEWAVGPDAMIETDPEFLRVAISNLFDNAVSYAPQAGTISIRADGDGTLLIGNDAVDLSPDAVAHAFNAFWRSDEAREEVGVHAGLGLALCQKVIDLLGGSISARTSENADRFEVVMDFSAA